MLDIVVAIPIRIVKATVEKDINIINKICIKTHQRMFRINLHTNSQYRWAKKNTIFKNKIFKNYTKLQQKS